MVFLLTSFFNIYKLLVISNKYDKVLVTVIENFKEQLYSKCLVLAVIIKMCIWTCKIFIYQ